MKKLILFILMIIVNFSLFNFSYAADDPTSSCGSTIVTKVVVTENVPWAWCEPDTSVESGSLNDPAKRRYICEVDSWFGSVLNMLRWIIKYVSFLAILWAILMLVASWIRMSVEWQKADAKKMFINVIKALLVLFLMWFILNTVAPWIYK